MNLNQVDRLAAVLALSAYISIILYAPFAKSWKRALVMPFAITVAWVVTMLVADIHFDEDTGPLIYCIILPIESLIFAATARFLKQVLFKIPALEKCENRFRSRFEKALSRKACNDSNKT